MRSRQFTSDRIPCVPNAHSYYTDWVVWWTSCQPAWRQNNGWPLPRDNTGTTDWVKVGARGQSGLFLVIMSTTWWASSIESEEDWVLFDAAVDDVRWFIDQVSDHLKGLPAPAPHPPPENPQKADGANWMSRAGGKRKPKPSRRLLEAGGA